jgi:hypothetical protein
MSDEARVTRREVHGEMITKYDCEFPLVLEFALESALIKVRKYHVLVQDYYDWKGDPDEETHFVLDLANLPGTELERLDSEHCTCLVYYIKTSSKTIECCIKITSCFPDNSSDEVDGIYRELADCCLEVLEGYDDITVKNA